jgi:hypothetical protein
MNRRIIAFPLVAGLLLVLWSFHRAARAPVSNEVLADSGAPLRDVPIAARSIKPRSTVPKFMGEPDAQTSDEEANPVRLRQGGGREGPGSARGAGFSPFSAADASLLPAPLRLRMR